MQTIGYSSERRVSSAAGSMLERLGWLDKLPIMVIAGGVFGLSSPSVGVWWLAWSGLAPLMVLSFACRTKTEAALTGLTFGMAYHLVSMRWMLDLHPLSGFAANNPVGFMAVIQIWALKALQDSILLAIFAFFLSSLPMRAGWMPHYHRPFFPMLISVPLLWVFLQWSLAPASVFLGLPLDAFAYSQARVLELVQLAKYGGAVLVDFLIVFVNTALAALIIEMTDLARKPDSRMDIFSTRTGAAFDVLAAFLILVAAFQVGKLEVMKAAVMPESWPVSLYLHDKAAKPGTIKATAPADLPGSFRPAIPLAVVQPNAQGAQPSVDLVKGLGVPLCVLPAHVANSRRGGAAVISALQAECMSERKEFIVGSVESTPDGLLNGARLVSPQPERNGFSAKERLLPFAEYVPLGLIGQLMPPELKEKVLGDAGFVPGSPRLLQTSFGHVGCTLSSEIFFPGLTAGLVSKGATLVANLSDLSYFHKPLVGQQLLAAATFRAVENGRYVVLASNSGISAVIDPSGVVTSSSIPSQKGVLLDRVQFLNEKTPFTKMWWLWTPFIR